MAKRQIHKLNARQVATLSKPGWHGDGGGLYLRISNDDRKRWVFVFILAGRRREMGLGAAAGPAAVSLADARTVAAKAREKIKAGIDPLEHAKATDAAKAALDAAGAKEAAMPTFGTIADSYVEAMRPSWRNEKHAAQWVMTLTRYCKPIRGKRIDQIGTDDVLTVLKPLWSKRPETAQRLRGRIENVLDAAKANEHRTGENPARWRGHLENLLPARAKLTRGHHAALAYDAMPEFMASLREKDTIGARVLEFCILTVSRTSEALGARWTEFDLDKAEWAIPANRMKAGRAYRVPLSPRVLAIVKHMGKAKMSAFVFPSRGKGPLSNMTMAKVLERMGRNDITVHGFRSAFRDWAAEVSTFPHEVCEMALAHAIANKAEAAYRRGDLFEKRRALMTAWAAHCEPKAANVIPIKRPKAK
jgi:integrase